MLGKVLDYFLVYSITVYIRVFQNRVYLNVMLSIIMVIVGLIKTCTAIYILFLPCKLLKVCAFFKTYTYDM